MGIMGVMDTDACAFVVSDVMGRTVTTMTEEHCIMVCGLVMFLLGYIFGWIRRGR